MEAGIIVALIISGLFVGFINTLAGGGTIISMTLFLMLGLPPAVANGTNRIAILLQNIVAVSYFKKKKLLDLPKAVYFAIPVIIGAFAGSNIAIVMDEKIFNYCFAAVMLLLTVFIIWKPDKWLKENPEKTGKPVTLMQFLAYLLIGLYGGFIHVGMGYLLLIALVLMGGYDLLKANAIKNFIVLAYIPFSLIVFVYHGYVRYDYGLVHAIGNIIGAYVASRWASNWGSKFIRYILIFLILISALQLLGVFSIADIFSLFNLGEK